MQASVQELHLHRRLRSALFHMTTALWSSSLVKQGSQAVSRLNIPVFEPGEIRVGGCIAVGTDLLCNSTFKQLKTAIKKKRVRWLHTAPPCKTFSKARRRDRFAKARQLRSVQHPAGLEPKSWRVKEANLLASRAAQLSLLQWKVGGWFSMENP